MAIFNWFFPFPFKNSKWSLTHTFNHFYLASGMFLSTVKGVIFNLVLLIYVGSCYYKPKCLYRNARFLYRHKYYFPLRIQICFLYIIFVIMYNICNIKWRCSSTSIIPGLIKMSAFDWSMTRCYKTHATGW